MSIKQNEKPAVDLALVGFLSGIINKFGFIEKRDLMPLFRHGFHLTQLLVRLHNGRRLTCQVRDFKSITDDLLKGGSQNAIRDVSLTQASFADFQRKLDRLKADIRATVG